MPTAASEDNPIPSPENNSALEALTEFVSSYEPATEATASEYYSTDEIALGIYNLTGQRLESAEIYKLMKQMKYTYIADGTNFFWLLCKAVIVVSV